ncbi:tetratricopeptide repeat protein [Streptomyces graminilatus]|uniref:tetratricopeptide repeat protein n=1 Tax=Streptomyces graminilatus TaxID=1464070 RepID=UPI0006E3876D|nr:tetratricopeptide repeat protein [Streptomyces graminilatus]
MEEDDFETRAERQRAAGEHAAALALYLRAWTSRDDEVAEKILDLVEEWGDVDAALELTSATAGAGNAAAYEALADLLIQCDRSEEAVSALEEAARAGRDVTLWTGAVLADEVGDRTRAEEYYRRALAENNPKALNDYGAFLMDDGERLDEAADLLRRAIDQGDTMAAGNLGRLLVEKDGYEEALPWLRQALDAGHRTVLVVLGEAENAAGDMEAAGTRLREALAEDIPGARFAYALHLADNDSPREAVGYYEAAAEKDEEIAAYLNLAILHDELEEWEQADRRYRDAIEHQDELAFVNYARFLSEQGRGGEIGALLAPAAELDLDLEDMTELRALAEGKSTDES